MSKNNKSAKVSPELDTPTDLPQAAVDKISASLNVLLADAFARNARRRIDERFAAVFDNDDVLNYAIAQQTTAGKFAWVESGMVRDK